METSSELGRRVASEPLAAPSPAGPTWAVVVLGGNDLGAITEALKRVDPAWSSPMISMLVVHSNEGIERELATRFPTVVWLRLGAGSSEAEQRAIGFAAAGTDVVCFARPVEMLDPAWAAELEARFMGNGPAGRQTPDDWAIRLAERGVPGGVG